METVMIIIVLALIQFYWFGVEVGQMRGKHKCKAPATSGAAEFECMFRVQQNTMEQLVMFVPAIWLFGTLVNPMWAAGMGVIYLLGRFIYRASYVKNPKSRSLGFSISVLPTSVMLIWVLVVLILRMV